ncbi:hypothetical protein OAV42_01745 [Ilumatobacter sp.]|uniref:hypothetical protein n=1 Tax=uncultured Ilumatobacter sp. TaxID=879968 RepID=UPI00374EC686|nr:hypothetical protein [Ilumatobacter sp.]
MTFGSLSRRLGAVAVLFALLGCSGSADSAAAPNSSPFGLEIRAAVAAIEAELEGTQEYFEITATPQFTNVFVAVDDGTAAAPYVFLAGELQPPGPTIEGAAGQTFTAASLDFDDEIILAGVAVDLPTASIDALSIEGGPGGFVRYVISARSAQGGVLDIVVAPSGAVIEVRPL